jgi:DNA-binding NarL/FixJ family response regulator
MIRVMLINDFKLISNLIAGSLADEPDIEVVRTCSPDEDLIGILQEEDVDVLVISGEFAAYKAIDLVSKIDALELPLQIVVLGLDDRHRSILPYLEAGASGYILKDSSVDEVIGAIRAASNGHANISPNMARALIERVYILANEINSLDKSIFNNVTLTSRETQVLELLGENLSNAEISERLHIEEGTVKNHVHSILQKLEVNTRREAVKYLGLLREKDNGAQP